MPNSKLTLQDCIFTDHYITPDGKIFRGKIFWMEGSIEFKKGCCSFSADVIKIIDANKNPEARFSMIGSLTKKPGKKGTKWENNFFEEIIVQEVIVSNGAKKFNAQELVDTAKKKLEISDEESDNEVSF